LAIWPNRPNSRPLVFPPLSLTYGPHPQAPPSSPRSRRQDPAQPRHVAPCSDPTARAMAAPRPSAFSTGNRCPLLLFPPFPLLPPHYGAPLMAINGMMVGRPFPLPPAPSPLPSPYKWNQTSLFLPCPCSPSLSRSPLSLPASCPARRREARRRTVRARPPFAVRAARRRFA
jgi:hypothetical protein